MTRQDNNINNNGQFTHKTPQAISAVFILLAFSLQISLVLYWTEVLQPKLRSEAAADAQIIAESQATQLLNALESSDQEEQADAIDNIMSRLLLYQEPTSGQPFFKSITLELDDEMFPGIATISEGDANCETCFEVEIPLYSQESFVLLGIGKFTVSDEFFKRLAKDISTQLLIEGAITLLLLLIAWGTSLFLIKSLNKEISRRKASEEALTENQQKYHRLVSSLNQYFVYTRNADGNITLISDTVTKLYGYSTKEMLNLKELLTTNPINNVARHYLKKAPDANSQIEFEAEIRDTQQNLRWILFSEVTIVDDNDKVISVEGLGRDITRQKDIERDLTDAKEEAEVASQAKGQFLANMSHEIRTPMNAIIGNTYLIQKTPLSTKQQQFVKRVDSSAHVLLGLVNDILDISKIEAGKMELESIPFTINEVLSNLSNVVIGQIQAKGLDLLFDVAPEIPQPLQGDPLRLGQIILNLVNNAIKFTDSGEILVAITVVKQENSNLTLQFSVRDDGIGIEEDKQKLLFKSFNQVDNSMTRRYGGTGLGLAICQHLVSMMAGDIWVESKYGQGSTFRFEAGFALGMGSNEAPAPYLASLQHQHVLVVDDSETACHVLSRILNRLGMDVTVSHSGENAMKTIRDKQSHHPVSFVLIDHKMPGLSGIETVQSIEKRWQHVHLPKFILMTTLGIDDKHSTEIEHSFVDVLYKPVTESSVFESLARSINSAQANKPEPDTAKATIPDLQQKRILLVDDNKINQEVALALLEDINANTWVAENGQDAINQVKQQDFDLILMDIQMPVMDGLTASLKMRQELSITIPIIAMTAHALEEDREKSRKAGMDDYITKPIDVDAFYRTLQRWLPSAPASNNATPKKESVATSAEIKINGLDVPTLFKRIGNREDLFLELLEEFCRSYDGFPEALNAAIKDNDSDKIAALLHRLKGEAGNIAADELHQQAIRLESAFKKSQSLDDISIAQLLSSINTLCDNMQSHIASQHQKPPLPDENLMGSNDTLSAEQISELLESLNELTTRFETQSLDAIELATSVIQRLQGHINEELLADFNSDVHQLDFELAKSHLIKIRKLLHKQSTASLQADTSNE